MLIKQFFSKLAFSSIFRRFNTINTSKDHYKVLGLTEKSKESEIRQAYLNLVKKHHPDCPTGSAEKFKEINEAYEILSDKSLRSQYDALKNFKKQSNTSYSYQNYQNKDERAYEYWKEQERKNLYEEWVKFNEKREKAKENMRQKTKERPKSSWKSSYKNMNEFWEAENQRGDYYNKYKDDREGKEDDKSYTMLVDTLTVVYFIAFCGLFFYAIAAVRQSRNERDREARELFVKQKQKYRQEVEMLKEYERTRQIPTRPDL